MQQKDAIKLRARWEKKGNPPCEHPRLDKEYIEGFDTGDKVCTTCGKNFAPYELDDDGLLIGKFKPGDKVIVTGGEYKGQKGVIIRKDHLAEPGGPQKPAWLVKLENGTKHKFYGVQLKPDDSE